MLRSEGNGCFIGEDFIGCLLFADDILLMSSSIWHLQYMLDVCYTYCQEWDLKFNVKKSNVMIVGKSDGAVMPPIHLGTELLCWVSEMKYLGVILYSKGGLRVNVHVNCRKFLGSSFSILQSCRGFNEQVLCEIILTKCLPILMYGLESFRLLAAERDKVKMAFNCVIRRIFKLSKFTSVRHIIHMIGSKPGIYFD